MDLKTSPRRDETPRRPKEPAVGSPSPGALIVVAALAALCCGAPLLIAAFVAVGGAGWFIGHGSLLAVPAAGLAAGLLWWRAKRRRD